MFIKKVPNNHHSILKSVILKIGKSFSAFNHTAYMEEEKQLPSQTEHTKNNLNFVNTAVNTFDIDPNPTNNVSKQVRFI
jgi:hypothetical protein